MKNKKQVLIIVLVAVALLAILSFLTMVQNKRQEIAGPSLPKEEERVKAPEFDLMTLDGEELRLSELKGKIVLLTFFSTGCDACKVMFPELARFYKRSDKNKYIIAS